jgi:hypothetical protein
MGQDLDFSPRCSTCFHHLNSEPWIFLFLGRYRFDGRQSDVISICNNKINAQQKKKGEKNYKE